MKAYSEANAYQTEYEKKLAEIFRGAKKRCCNTKAAGYKNYGGRGIEFRFTSIREGVAYAKANLPERKEKESLDRIDNDGHYEAGNLRWADRTTQRLNQRTHFRGSVHSRRIDSLQKKRQDYSRESLRRLVIAGLTDDEILARRKGENNGVTKRHKR